MFEAYRLLSPLVFSGGVYLQIRQYRSNMILDLADHYLLFCNHILMVSIFLGGWIMQVIYYSVLGTHTYIGFIICSYSRHNPSSDSLFNIMLLNACLLSYLLLKVYTQKSNLFDVGETICGQIYQGVGVSLNGWNCTYVQFWIFSLFWLIQQIFSLKIGHLIIKREPEVDHQWKRHFLNKKVLPTLFFLIVIVGYNLSAYLNVDSPIQCMSFWIGDSLLQKFLIQIFKIIAYIGPSAATLLFYFTTLPHFRRAPPTQNLQQPLMLT